MQFTLRGLLAVVTWLSVAMAVLAASRDDPDARVPALVLVYYTVGATTIVVATRAVDRPSCPTEAVILLTVPLSLVVWGWMLLSLVHDVWNLLA